LKNKGYKYNQDIYKYKNFKFIVQNHALKVIAEDKTSLTKHYQKQSVSLAITSITGDFGPPRDCEFLGVPNCGNFAVTAS